MRCEYTIDRETVENLSHARQIRYAVFGLKLFREVYGVSNLSHYLETIKLAEQAINGVIDVEKLDNFANKLQSIQNKDTSKHYSMLLCARVLWTCYQYDSPMQAYKVIRDVMDWGWDCNIDNWDEHHDYIGQNQFHYFRKLLDEEIEELNASKG
jgi:hypothetical protein